jgi:diguanylate cyclase (GGDEF)-like protein
VILAVGLVAFGFGTWFSIRLTRPIIGVAEKANELAGGNLRVNVVSNRQDEIGFLASCFNRMTVRIRQKVFELSALYRVSQLISHAPSYQRALDDSLAHLVTIFTSQRGSIMLLNEDGTQLKLQSVRSFGQIDGAAAAPIEEQVVLMFGEGLAGEAVRTGQPILCLDCAHDERFKAYPAAATVSPPQTLLVMPLVMQGTVIGVINLADRSVANAFGGEDLEVLKTIASQMAMSIENARLHELAITDGLTRLFIHRYFQIKLEDEIKRSRRYRTPLSLILFDIDHFKKFNDTYGHQQGDAVLREVSAILKQAVRGTDLPCRYGGEEFAVILAHTTAEQAFLFAERLRKSVQDHGFTGQAEPLHVTISVGIAEFPTMAGDKTEMVRKADIALYHCKERGRNCTSIWNEHM